MQIDCKRYRWAVLGIHQSLGDEVSPEYQSRSLLGDFHVIISSIDRRLEFEQNRRVNWSNKSPVGWRRSKENNLRLAKRSS